MDHLDGEYLLEHPMIEYNEALRTLWQVRSDSHARKSCCYCMRVPYKKNLHDWTPCWTHSLGLGLPLNTHRVLSLTASCRCGKQLAYCTGKPYINNFTTSMWEEWKIFLENHFMSYMDGMTTGTFVFDHPLYRGSTRISTHVKAKLGRFLDRFKSVCSCCALFCFGWARRVR